MAPIYESPDGGHSVYKRDERSLTRELVHEDAYAKKVKEKIEWNYIFEIADSNPALKKAVENVILLYRLSETNEQTRR